MCANKDRLILYMASAKLPPRCAAPHSVAEPLSVTDEGPAVLNRHRRPRYSMLEAGSMPPHQLHSMGFLLDGAPSVGPSVVSLDHWSSHRESLASFTKVSLMPLYAVHHFFTGRRPGQHVLAHLSPRHRCCKHATDSTSLAGQNHRAPRPLSTPPAMSSSLPSHTAVEKLHW
jgi:hypothetical protein